MEPKDLYRALEFAHYADRLRDTVTVLGLSRNTPFKNVILDIKVLAAYRARVVVVAADPEFKLQRILALMNTHGGRFRLIEAQEPREPRTERLRVNIKHVEAALEDDEVPVVVHHGLTEHGADIAAVEHMVREIAFATKARRCVAMANLGALENALTRTRITLEELPRVKETLVELGLPEWTERLENVKLTLEGGVAEIAYLLSEPGRLCQELFTHEGAGILFCRHDDCVVRRAELRDINDIMLQLRPDIDSGTIRDVTENGISERIRDFWVAEVSGRIVATMRIKRYGSWVELATGSTLLRDRKRGRARELMAHAMAAVEEEKDVSAMFAVSLNERLLQSLEPMGFERVDRSALPEEWRRGYDDERPSMVYAKRLRT